MEVVDHEFPDCETSTQFKFNLDSGVPDVMLNHICDGRINFLSVVDLIYTFEDTSVDNASIIKGFGERVNIFILSYNPSNAKTIVLERLNIFSSVFEKC